MAAAASSCGFCQRTATPQSNTLFQIRRGYRSSWRDLAFSVEADSNQWTLKVQDHGKNLYSGKRSNPEAAKSAAAEFAIFLLLGAMSRETPESLAARLTWTAYW